MKTAEMIALYGAVFVFAVATITNTLDCILAAVSHNWAGLALDAFCAAGTLNMTWLLSRVARRYA